MIPDDILAFIETSVPSVPHLEAVLLFRASGATERRTRDVAQHLYVDTHDALVVIADLIAARLVVYGAAGGFLYAPRAPDSAVMLDRLADLYASELVSLTKAIHAARRRREHNGGRRRQG